MTIAMGGSVDASAVNRPDKRRHPEWIRAKLPSGDNYNELKALVRGQSLNTVCEEACCPNIGECWEQRTATVMILGDTCTRACGFCAVKTGRPTWYDPDEPRRVAEAIKVMGLEHVVVTSVARDDLPDGGASCLRRDHPPVRRASPHTGVEVLIPDFNGENGPLRTVMVAAPDILNHNIETVDRLQKPVRKRARYDRSLRGARGGQGTGDRDRRTTRVPCTPSRASWSAWVNTRRAQPDVPRPARRRLRHPHPGPVPAPDRRVTCPSNATSIPTSSRR